MIHAKLCLSLTALAFVILTVFSADEVNARDLMQCKGSNQKSVVSCCMKSTMHFKPKWFIDSGSSCSQVVSCGGGVKVRNRCVVAIPPPPTTGSNPPPPARVMISDLRLKKNIHLVGTTVLGLPLYDFQYINSINQPGVFEGVMAQDVLKVKPEAVTLGTDGFYRVNYSMLGIEMKRLQ